MKKRSPLVTVAIALVGVLLVAMGLIALGSRQTRSFPSANSYEPSGTAAFAELLRRSGYVVVVDTLPVPKLEKGDVAVAFYQTAPTNTILSSETNDAELQPVKDELAKFVRAGGALISFPVSPDFQADSLRLYKKRALVSDGNDSEAFVSWDRSGAAGAFIDQESKETSELWGTDDDKQDAFVTIRQMKNDGVDAVFSEGIVATNRFIDQQDNATVLVDVVKTLAAPPSRVVFVEASFGNGVAPSLTETIGPWAKAAWMQLVFLVLVMVYTLGKPFGLPDPQRRQERGSRELLDAMADTLQRGRMTKLALRTVYDDANRQLRKRFRTPVNTDHPGADSMGALQSSLARVNAASLMGAPEDAAAKLIGDVERLMKEVAGRTPSL